MQCKNEHHTLNDNRLPLEVRFTRGALTMTMNGIFLLLPRVVQLRVQSLFATKPL
jgi:hypothetical protein